LPYRIKEKRVGDINKAAARMFEVVAGTGFGKALVENGKREWLRIPLGPDCGASWRAKLRLVAENVEALEPIWSSTEMDEEQLERIRECNK
jgi:hypothetical protein